MDVPEDELDGVRELITIGVVRHGEHTSVLSARCIMIDNGFMLLIEGNGKGVPLPFKGRIFERRFGANTGLGLFLVREILGITGMQIIETGVEGKGARFEIQVPPGYFKNLNTSCRQYVTIESQG